MDQGAPKRRKPPSAPAATGSGGGSSNLTGMAAVQHVFHFLHGPADVLRAATAGRRWRDMAHADAVWRIKFKREGMEEKAGVFEVALAGAGGGGKGGGGGSAAAEGHV